GAGAHSPGAAEDPQHPATGIEGRVRLGHVQQRGARREPRDTDSVELWMTGVRAAGLWTAPTSGVTAELGGSPEQICCGKGTAPAGGAGAVDVVGQGGMTHNARAATLTGSAVISVCTTLRMLSKLSAKPEPAHPRQILSRNSPDRGMTPSAESVIPAVVTPVNSACINVVAPGPAG